MPFVSNAQRKWMYANNPKMAAEWSAATPKGKKLPEHKKKCVQVQVGERLLNFEF